MDVERSSHPQSSGRRATSSATAKEGYERRDISFGWIAGIVIILAIAGVAMHFTLGAWLNKLDRTPRVRDPWAQAKLGPEMPLQARGVPQLQVSPTLDLEKFRAREQEELNSYGWIDRHAGVVKIPIDRAMELLVQENAGTNAVAKD